MTNPRVTGMLNRPLQRAKDQGARLAIRERTPAFGGTSTTTIDATLPIGSGTEITQEDVDAIGIKQVGTDDASLRIIPSAGSKAALQFFDGSTEKWKNYKHTDNAWKLQDLTGSYVSTFTVPISTPAAAVFTAAVAHGLTAGTPVRFSTTGALPTGLTAGTTYYVIAAGLGTNAFEVSTTVGGSAVVTSGSQSGTHTVLQLVASDFLFAKSGDNDGGGLWLSRRLTLTSVNQPGIWTQGALDAGTLAGAKIFAAATSFTGAWSNGGTGDQLFKDQNQDNFFKTGSLFRTQNPVSFNKVGTCNSFDGQVHSQQVEGTISLNNAVVSTSAFYGGNAKTITCAAPHGYDSQPSQAAAGAPTDGVVSIAGVTGVRAGLVGTWHISNITSTTFDLQSTQAGITNGTIADAAAVSQRQLHKDVTSSVHYVFADSVAATGIGTAGGTCSCSEWKTTIGVGAWSKSVGLNQLVAENNSYLSYSTLANGPNQTFYPTSSWRRAGSIGAQLVSVAVGQPGTGLMITNAIGCGRFKRAIAVGCDIDIGTRTVGDDIFCVDSGDATGARVGIGVKACVTQDINTSGLAARLQIAAEDEPITPEEGIQLGAGTNALKMFRNSGTVPGEPILKLTDYAGSANGHLWATGSITCGEQLFLTATNGTGYLYLPEQSSAPGGTANTAKVYVDDDGTGKTRVNWRVGATETKVIAKEGGLDSWAVGNMTATGSGASGDVGIYMANTGQMDCLRASGSWMRNFLAAADMNPVARFVATGEYQVGKGGSGTVTVTIASPAVFTKTAHGFVANTKVQFSTTGALPTGLTAGTSYYVISAGLTANAFEVSTTVGGSAVNTSGSQSGVHTVGAAADVGYHRVSPGELTVTDGTNSGLGVSRAAAFSSAGAAGLGYVGLGEQSAVPATPTANRARLYLALTGGKQDLRIVWADGTTDSVKVHP